MKDVFQMDKLLLKKISMETNAITKEVLYVVFNNGDEVLKTSDLDDAIAKFNKY